MKISGKKSEEISCKRPLKIPGECENDAALISSVKRAGTPF
jgi:hypothetical protein